MSDAEPSPAPFVVLDACVLMSTVLRQLLLRTAQNGVFEPVWTERIGEEWRRNAARLWGASREILDDLWDAMNQAFPGAMESDTQAYETGLSGAGTTMVLAPDSSFFKYFGDPGKATVPAGPLAPETPAPSVAPVPDVIPPTDENTPEPPISGIAPKSTTAAPAAQPAPSPATAPTPSPATAPTPSPAVAPATPAPSTAAPATAAPVGTTPTP